MSLEPKKEFTTQRDLESKGPSGDSTGIPRRRLSSVAIMGFSVFVGIIILLHFIQPEFNPSRQFMSEYTFGDYGWLLNIAIIGNLIGSIALTLAVYHAYPPPHRSWICIICLGITTISVLTNFFPTDPHGKAITAAGYIHNLGAFFGTLAVLMVMFVFSIRLKRSGLLQGFYHILIVLAILAPIFFAIMLFAFDRISGIVGIAQRIYALLILTWLIAASFGIRSGAIVPEPK